MVRQPKRNAGGCQCYQHGSRKDKGAARARQTCTKNLPSAHRHTMEKQPSCQSAFCLAMAEVLATVIHLGAKSRGRWRTRAQTSNTVFNVLWTGRVPDLA